MSNYGSASVSVRFNNGRGVFSGTAQVAVGSNPAGVVLADFDRDRDLDLAVANSGTGTVSVRLNNGQGVFAATAEVAAGAGTWGVLAGDVDGDGDLDVVTANNGAGNVSVRLNNGQGMFSGSTQVVVGSSPRGIAAADVDGDGDLDLVTANYLAAACSVLFNRSLSQISSIARVDNDDIEQRSVIYSNPFAGDLTLKVGSKETEKLLITIIDAYGKVVYVNDNHTTNLSITLHPDIPAGVYILQARYGTFIRIFRIVKIE
ncbi:T9SS type A sorting domain-containing protein [Rhodocytophaga rosea]|uniref:T9SS type A sorting domain-containing protein n=1 Tax=Rhodocytophaga rosea TaxID=2704465 RepID=A0A6C0GE71_9BACT|nr:T9SS type A sorting domain-containing protein [Rhodocytophaga rosea]